MTSLWIAFKYYSLDENIMQEIKYLDPMEIYIQKGFEDRITKLQSMKKFKRDCQYLGGRWSLEKPYPALYRYEGKCELDEVDSVAMDDVYGNVYKSGITDEISPTKLREIYGRQNYGVTTVMAKSSKKKSSMLGWKLPMVVLGLTTSGSEKDGLTLRKKKGKKEELYRVRSSNPPKAITEHTISKAFRKKLAPKGFPYPINIGSMRMVFNDNLKKCVVIANTDLDSNRAEDQLFGNSREDPELAHIEEVRVECDL